MMHILNLAIMRLPDKITKIVAAINNSFKVYEKNIQHSTCKRTNTIIHSTIHLIQGCRKPYHFFPKPAASIHS